MSTKIEWTDETWNPTTGCDRTSPGCHNCYALTMAKRLKAMGSAKYQNDGDPKTSGPGFALTVHDDSLTEPLRWKKPRRVFVNSMSDLFHKDVPDQFIFQVFAVMAMAPQHTFQVLTKRPQRMAKLLADARTRHFVDSAMSHLLGVEVAEFEPTDGVWGQSSVQRLSRAIGDALVAAGLDRLGISWPLPNVWLGVSIESDTYSWRADYLRDTPAAVRFISAEPLLGPLSSLDLTGIDWLIVGGESGPNARPMHPQWARDLRDRCVDNDAAEPCDRPAFLFKQWGSWAPTGERGLGSPDPHRELVAPPFDEHGCGEVVARMSKAEAGRVLDGQTWDEFPVVES